MNRVKLLMVAVIVVSMSFLGASCSQTKTPKNPSRADQKQILALENTVANLKTQITDQDATITDLKSKLAEANTRADEAVAEAQRLKQRGNLWAGYQERIDTLQARLAEALAKGNQTNPDLEKKLKELQEELARIKGTQVKIRNGNLVIVLDTKVFYRTLSAELNTKGKEHLATVAEVINSKFAGYHVRVEGHADSKPIRKSRRYPTNWELSADRATKAVRFLEKEGKVDSKRLSTAAYSFHRPVAPNDNNKNRSKNRRVEIVLVKKNN